MSSFAMDFSDAEKAGMECFESSETLVDPFYSDSNIAHIGRGIEAIKEGRGIEEDLIEDRADAVPVLESRQKNQEQ